MNPFYVFRHHGHLVAFGFFMCFCSSIGQTFFIALFNGDLRRAYGLSHGDIGAMYAAGTIASAVTLMFAGRLIDRARLQFVVVGVFGGLAASALGMALVSGAFLLPIVFYGLRLFGQGLASHTAMTAMGRYFDNTRGRAISFASLGYSGGEALLPTAVVVGLTYVAWQSLWIGIAGAMILAIPAALYMLKAELPKPQREAFARPELLPSDLRLGEVLRDGTFWLRMPTFLAPAFITTGLFFHQIHLAEEYNWSLQLLAGSFTAFAISSIATTLLAGPLVDRLSARRVWPWVLLPLASSCMALATSSANWIAPLFMILIGVTSGLHSIAGTAMWPELYGTRHLGAIKAFTQAMMVLASGLAPLIFGLLIDQNFSMSLIAVTCAIWCVLASILAVLVARHNS